MLVQEPKGPGRKGGDDDTAIPALVTTSDHAAPIQRQRIYVGLDVGYREHVAAASPLSVSTWGATQTAGGA
jgi:hypothetical protein